MTTPFIYLRFSQTDTDTEIYFTRFTNTDTPIFLGRISPQAHTTFPSFFPWAEHVTSPLKFYLHMLLVWALCLSPMTIVCSFSFFLSCAAYHPNEPTPCLLKYTHVSSPFGSPFSWHQVPYLPLTLFHETRNHLWAVNPLDKRNTHPRLVIPWVACLLTSHILTPMSLISLILNT